MIAKTIRLFSASIVCAGFATTASATPLLWTLNALTFDDGGTAPGSFVYYAESNHFSAANPKTTAGSTLPGPTLRCVCSPPCVSTTWADSDVVFLFAGAATDLAGAPAFVRSFTTH